MNPVLLRYVGIALLAMIFGVGGGYLAINNKSVTAPQSGTIVAVPAQPFPGQGIPAIPAVPAIPVDIKKSTDCPVVPYHQIYSAGISGSADVAAYPNDIPRFLKSLNLNLRINTLFRAKKGALFAGGFEPIPYNFSPVLYKSIDEGKTWTLVNFPGTATAYGIINHIVEDSKGNLYVAGIGFVGKSADGGNTWKILSNGLNARNFILLKDDSLVITPHAWDRNVYKSSDGGLTWNVLFNSGNYVDIRSIVEADNGDLIISGDDGWSYDGSSTVFKFSNGQLTGVLTYPTYSVHDLYRVYAVESAKPLLKAKDGTLYFSVTEQKKKGDSYTGPINVLYVSSDNGTSWKMVGDIVEGWDYFRSIKQLMEGSNGSLYASVMSTKCWGGTVFKSVDKGRKWQVLSGNMPGMLTAYAPTDYTEGMILEAMVEAGGKILNTGWTGGVIFTNP